jgi:nickel transport protein
MTLRHPAVRFSAATSLAAVAALLVGPGPAHSHALESSLERLSSLTDQLVLDSRFGNGEPADDAVVRLVPPSGIPIEVGRTDSNGQLRFRLPEGASAAWEVQVDRGPGHRDYLELPGAGPTSPRAAAPTTLLGRQRAAGWQPLGLAAIVGTLGGGVLGGSLAWRRSRRHGRR